MAAYPAHAICALMTMCWAVQAVVQIKSLGGPCLCILHQMLSGMVYTGTCMGEDLYVQLQARCMPASAYLSATRRMFFVFQPWMSCSSMMPPFGGELGSAK